MQQNLGEEEKILVYNIYKGEQVKFDKLFKYKKIIIILCGKRQVVYKIKRSKNKEINLRRVSRECVF